MEKRLIDFSFMASLKCNLSCEHCMYESSPSNNARLNLKQTEKFISTINFDKINSCGFYGGEISCDYELYQSIIDMLPKDSIKFTITNGSWSNNEAATKRFADFAQKNNLQVFISSTKFQKLFQHSDRLKKIISKYDFIIKDDDYVIPMGRAKKEDWSCSKKCLFYKVPMRLTLNPYGQIMFCNCDGVYPLVGTYNDKFETIVNNALSLNKFCPKLKN